VLTRYVDFTGLAFLTSLLAFALSLINYLSAKQHNRLSVRPIINIIHEKAAEYNKEQQALVGTLSIVIINNGIGPAIVESFDLFVDGQKIVANDDQKWEYASKKLFALAGDDKPPKHFGYGVFNLSKGYCIPSRERIVLFSIKFTMNLSDMIQKSLDRSRAVVVYRSLYKDKYTYDTDKVKLGEVELPE
jgi:hypothetical protein